MGRQSVAELDLEALESAVRRQALQLAGRAVEQRLNADHSDADSSALPCACGESARHVGRREKTFASVLGPLKLARAYFHCAHCGHGFCPRDKQLGLENTVLSPAVTRMVGTVGAMVSFEEGSQLLAELAGLSVDAKQVERSAEALGADIARDEQQDVTAPHHLPLPPTLYLGLDGTGIPMRSSELQGRSGKQPDGAAKTREVKLCTVWSAEGRDKNDTPTRDPGSITYSAAIETAATPDCNKQRSPFTERALREATRRRFMEAACAVVIGDGAPWLWSIAHELFPRAIQIVDRFHVQEHLSDVSKILYVNKPQQAKAWARRRHEELNSGRLTDLLRALRRHADHCDDARKCLQYILGNRERMRYPKFHAQGLCTSSA